MSMHKCSICFIASDRHHNFSESFHPEIVTTISMSSLHLSLVLIEQWHQSNFLFHKTKKNKCKIGRKKAIQSEHKANTKKTLLQTSKTMHILGNHRIIRMNFLLQNENGPLFSSSSLFSLAPIILFIATVFIHRNGLTHRKKKPWKLLALVNTTHLSLNFYKTERFMGFCRQNNFTSLWLWFIVVFNFLLLQWPKRPNLSTKTLETYIFKGPCVAVGPNSTLFCGDEWQIV